MLLVVFCHFYTVLMLDSYAKQVDIPSNEVEKVVKSYYYSLFHGLFT